MKQPSRDTLLALGLILLLLALTSLAALWQARQGIDQPPLASFSNQPDGARALRLWLEGEGYRVLDERPGFFSGPSEAQLALLLEPQLPGIAEEEWAVLDEWVEAGGTLLLAGEGFAAAFAMEHYDFSVDYLDEAASDVRVVGRLTSPPLTSAEKLRARAVLQSDRTDYVTLLAAGDGPLLVTFTQGKGRVVLSTLRYPFSNEGLKEPDNPLLALNLAALAGREGTIWFDEWHHGQQGSSTEIAGPGQWLRQTAAGRALIYSALVLFVAILLGGRRFGRPVPLQRPQARRAPLEHISAVANLSRRAGHRHAVLQHYYRQLKRELGSRYRLSPTLPDEEFVAQLARFDPGLDAPALLRLLERLQNRGVSEGEMVELAQEATEWLEES